MLNRITIEGRLTAAPELKFTQSNTPVCTVCVAVERDYKNSEGNRDTDFITVVTWNRTAEFLSRYFSKGKMIVVDGRLQSRKWVDTGGENRTAWEIRADSIYFAGDSGNNATGQYNATTSAYKPQPGNTSVYNTPDVNFAALDTDDDVPF